MMRKSLGEAAPPFPLPRQPLLPRQPALPPLPRFVSEPWAWGAAGGWAYLMLGAGARAGPGGDIRCDGATGRWGNWRRLSSRLRLGQRLLLPTLSYLLAPPQPGSGCACGRVEPGAEAGGGRWRRTGREELLGRLCRTEVGPLPTARGGMWGVRCWLSTEAMAAARISTASLRCPTCAAFAPPTRAPCPRAARAGAG